MATATQPGSRRALRDLVPATLATGAAAIVVTLLVGGATEDVRTNLVPGRGESVAGELAGVVRGTDPGASAGRVTVRVRPSRPRPLGVVAALELVPEGAGRASAAGRATAAPAGGGTRGLGRERAATPAVPGASSPATPAATTAPDASVAAPAAPAPDGPVAASGASDKRRRPVRSSPSSSKARNDASSGPDVTVASADRVAWASTDDGVTAADAEAADEAPARDRGRSDDAPPPHATARGHHRTR